MASEQKGKDFPPYPSYGTFTNFISGLKEVDIPLQIDRSIMPKLSGSQQSAIIGACKWFNLIDESNAPTQKMQNLVEAYGTKDYSQVLRNLLTESYDFMADGVLDLAKASGQQVADRFRDYGIQGSTVNKTMAFFLAAAKDADIKISPHVKPPKAPAAGKKRRSKTDPEDDSGSKERKGDGKPPPRTGMIKITVSAQRGIEDGAMYFPEGLTQSQWDHMKKFAMFALEHYMYEVAEELEDDDDEIAAAN